METPTPTPESAVPSSSTGLPHPSLMAVEDEVSEMTLTVKWSGKEYTVRVCGDDSVAELKRRICELTNVLPKRQKLLYPKIANKFADESLILSQLNLKPSIKMTMIGWALLMKLFPRIEERFNFLALWIEEFGYFLSSKT